MKLKEFIEVKSLTQKQIADITGCTQGAISHICTGRRKPRPDIANKIVKATKGAVSFADLYADRS